MKRSTTLFVLIAAWMISSCDPDIHEVGLVGTLVGTTIDEYQNPLDDVIVTVEGGDRIIEITSDTLGKFTIPDLHTSTYVFKFSKEGYGTNFIQGFPFVGGIAKTYVSAALPVLPRFKVNEIEAEIINSNDEYVQISITSTLDQTVTNENHSQFPLRYFLHADADISPARYTDSGLQVPYVDSSGALRFTILVRLARYPAGNLHILVHPGSQSTLGYTDLDTGRKIFAGTGPNGSPVIRLTLP